MDNKQEKGGSIFHGLAEFSHKLADVAFPEEDAEKDGVKVKAAETKEQKSPDIINAPNLSGPSDPKIREVLERALKDKGSLYTQFTEMVESFCAIIPDEKQRYKAAAVVMQRTFPGVIPKALDESLDERVQALEEEYQRFLKSLDTQNARIAEKEKAASAKMEQIEALRKEISKLEEEKNEINVTITQEREKITKIQQNFEFALADVRKDIISSREIIMKHLS